MQGQVLGQDEVLLTRDAHCRTKADGEYDNLIDPFLNPFSKNRSACQNRCVGLDCQVVAAHAQILHKCCFNHDKDHCKLEKIQLVDKNQGQ